MIKTIHTFGDSHACKEFSHWGSIKIDNVDIKCNHLRGRLMFTVGRLGLNLLNIKNCGVNEGDTVIFCFGEIDCRNHVHKHINSRISYKDVINSLVSNYINVINQNVR